MTAAAARDQQLAARAKRHDARYCLTIVQEARRADLKISLAFALVEQESNFRNVFGHDPSIYSGAGQVTKRKVNGYMRARGAHGRHGMQGVGVTQLTWWEFQDEAERMGGLHWPRYQCRVAFRLLKDLIARHGEQRGIARYNGSGAAAERYARSVRDRQHQWHERLT